MITILAKVSALVSTEPAPPSVSWQIAGEEQLAAPVTDKFYRAMTDNDLAPFEVLVPDVYGKDWLEAGINALTGEGLAIKVWQRSAGEVEVETARHLRRWQAIQPSHLHHQQQWSL